MIYFPFIYRRNLERSDSIILKRADLEALQWSLIETTARVDPRYSRDARHIAHDLRQIAFSRSTRWEFMLEILESQALAKEGDHKKAIAKLCAVRERLKAKCDRADFRKLHDDEHSVKFLQLSLALAKAELARQLLAESKNGRKKKVVNEALTELQQARDLCPREIYFTEQRIVALTELRKFDEALKAAQEIPLTEISDDAQRRQRMFLGYTWWRRALAEAAAGEYEKADASLRHAGDHYDADGTRFDHAMTLERRALICLRLGRDDDAEEYLSAASKQIELARWESNEKSDDQGTKELSKLEDAGAQILGLRSILTLARSGVSADVFEDIRAWLGPERTDEVWSRLVRDAGAIERRPDLLRALEFEVFRRHAQPTSPAAAHELSQASLALFGAVRRSDGPIVSLAIDLSVEIDSGRFGAEGAEAVRARLERLCRQISRTYGFEIRPPFVRASDDAWPDDVGYLLTLRETTTVHGEFLRGRVLAVGKPRAFIAAEIPYKSPAPGGVGEAGAWLDPETAAALADSGLRRIDALDLISHHFRDFVCSRLAELVTRDEILRRIEKPDPGSTDAGQEQTARIVTGVLQTARRLLGRQIPIRDLARICEAVAAETDNGHTVDDIAEALTRQSGFRRSPPPQADAPVEDLTREASARATPDWRSGQRRPAFPRAAFDHDERIAFSVELMESKRTGDPKWRDRFLRVLRRRVDELMSQLSHRARPRIEIRDVESLRPGAAHGLSIAGERCRVRRKLAIEPDPDALAAAEQVYASIFANRMKLLTPAAVQAVDAALSPIGSNPARDGRRLLDSALSRGIAVGRLIEGWEPYRCGDDDARLGRYGLELLLADCAAPKIAIRLDADLFPRVSAALEAAGKSQDAWLEDARKRLFWTLGFWPPPLGFDREATAGARGRATGQDEEAVFVVVIEISDAPVSLDYLRDGPDPLGALGEILHERLRDVADMLLDMRVVQRLLHDLSRYHPHLAADQLGAFGVCEILDLYRGLVRERDSLRDQRLIADTMLAARHPFDAADDSASAVPHALPSEAAHAILVARRLAARMRHRTTIPAFGLDSDVADWLSGAPEPDAGDPEHDRLIDSVHQAFAARPRIGPDPVVAVDRSLRAAMRRHTEVEFPDLLVIAREDRPAAFQFQRLGKIGFASD